MAKLRSAGKISTRTFSLARSPQQCTGSLEHTENTENTPRIFTHRHTQTSVDREDCLQQYGEPYDEKKASLFFVIRVSVSPNVKTLGGPVSRGAQAILQSMIKDIPCPVKFPL
jgi:hypothetical protein